MPLSPFHLDDLSPCLVHALLEGGPQSRMQGERHIEWLHETFPGLDDLIIRIEPSDVIMHQPVGDFHPRCDLDVTANSTVWHISPIHDSSCFVLAHSTQSGDIFPAQSAIPALTRPEVNQYNCVTDIADCGGLTRSSEPRHPSVETVGHFPAAGDGGRGFLGEVG